MVATSVSGKNRSLTRRLIALRLSSEVNWPLTRTQMRSGPACSTPDGAIAFCACSEVWIELLVEPERGDLAGREFEVDHLVLRADDVDASDIWDRQHLGADLLDAVAQLALRQSVAGEGIDIAVHVAETVVEEWPDDAARKVALDVGDHVADTHPGRRDVARLGGVAAG